MNEKFRVYNVVIFNIDGSHWKLKSRTKDEAKGAVKHWLPSWTTKAACVFNTENYGAKWFEKKKGGKVVTWVREPPTTTPTTTKEE